MAPAKREERGYRQGKDGKFYSVTPAKTKEWQACLGTKSDRLVPGDPSSLEPTPSTPKATTYQHQPLQPASHLWTETVTAGDSDTRKGIRKANKCAPITG